MLRYRIGRVVKRKADFVNVPVRREERLVKNSKVTQDFVGFIDAVNARLRAELVQAFSAARTHERFDIGKCGHRSWVKRDGLPDLIRKSIERMLGQPTAQ